MVNIKLMIINILIAHYIDSSHSTCIIIMTVNYKTALHYVHHHVQSKH